MTSKLIDISTILKIKPQKFEIKLKGRVPDKVTVKTQINCCQVIHKCFEKLNWREELLVFPMNNNNSVLGVYKLADGGLNSAQFDIRVLFQVLLLTNASCFFLAHNHPSQQLNASLEDIEINKRVKKAARMMGIGFLDHLVVTEDHFISIIDEH